MRTLIRLLTKLYPPQWRRRYGVEFDALLEDVEPNAQTALNVISGATSMQIQKWNAGTILAVGALGGVLLALGITTRIPKAYESVATIAMPGGPITPGTIDAINTVADDVESRRSLTQMIVMLGLYQSERSKMPIEDVIDVMKQHINIVPAHTDPATPAISVKFIYSDAILAQKVTAKLTEGFIDANLHRAPENTGLTMQVATPASLSKTPVAPRPSRNAIMGMLLGLTLGAMAAFLHSRRVKAA